MQFKILAIDDDANIVDVEKKILEAVGYKVDTALNAVEALKLARKIKYDLILMDIMMPGMDGFSLAEVFSLDIGVDKITDPPIIFISAKEEKEDIERSEKLGATAYIIKPFTSAMLINAVQDVLGKDDDEDLIFE